MKKDTTPNAYHINRKWSVPSYLWWNIIKVLKEPHCKLTLEDITFCLLFAYGLDATSAYLCAYKTKMTRVSAAPAASKLLRDERILSALKTIYVCHKENRIDINYKLLSLFDMVCPEFVIKEGETVEENTAKYNAYVIDQWLENNRALEDYQLFAEEDIIAHYTLEQYEITANMACAAPVFKYDFKSYNKAVHHAVNLASEKHYFLLRNMTTGKVEKVITANDFYFYTHSERPHNYLAGNEKYPTYISNFQ